METHMASNKNIIFSDNFLLTIEKETINEKYDNLIKENITINVIYLVFISICYISGMLLLIYFPISSENGKVDFKLGVACGCFIATSYVFLFVQIKYKVYTQYFLYITMGSVLMITNFNVSFFKIILSKELYLKYIYFIIPFNLNLNISYIIFADNQFKRSFIMILVAFILCIIFLIIDNDNNLEATLIFGFSLFSVYVMFSLLIYFLCKFSKTSFYFQERYLHQKNWIYDILNQWNSGVLIYNVSKNNVKFSNDYVINLKEFQSKNELCQDAKLSFCNMALEVDQCSIKEGEKENILKEKSNQEHIFDNGLSDSRFFNDKIRTKEILENYNFFKNLFDVNQDLPLELREGFFTKSFNEIIELILKLFKPASILDSDLEIKSSFIFKTFIYFGRLYLHKNGEKLIFEFYMKGLKDIQSSDTYFEFMFYDASKTFKIEEQRLKDQSMILGKISHEFKNPLFVIDELIKQIHEEYEDLSNEDYLEETEEFLPKLHFIKNLCNYMLILVKDFEVVSSLDNQHHLNIFTGKVNLEEFFSDIKEIVLILIKKKNAISPIKFRLINETNIESFITDKVRLKQILINLLSNSVKFTDSGYIELKIEIIEKEDESIRYYQVEDLESLGIVNSKRYHEGEKLQASPKLEKIRFSIIDTGLGFSPEFAENINNELKQNEMIKKNNRQDNVYGTGYGLNIVKNICKALQSKLNAKTNQPQGSIFYFELFQNEIQKKPEPKTNNNEDFFIRFKNQKSEQKEQKVNDVNYFGGSKNIKNCFEESRNNNFESEKIEKLEDNFKLIFKDNFKNPKNLCRRGTKPAVQDLTQALVPLIFGTDFSGKNRELFVVPRQILSDDLGGNCGHKKLQDQIFVKEITKDDQKTILRNFDIKIPQGFRHNSGFNKEQQPTFESNEKDIILFKPPIRKYLSSFSEYDFFMKPINQFSDNFNDGFFSRDRKLSGGNIIIQGNNYRFIL